MLISACGNGINSTYDYDNNGNQITRTINGVTLTLAYDADGRMVSVTGQGITASFTYDGDGKRVKSEINGTSTYFVGNYYEISGSTITKYYYAGANRVAMKTGSTVYYLLSDHLGSISLTADAGGNVVSEMRYGAWGNVRYQSGTTPTRYTYTGQASNVSDFGLMYYGARWYDPYLNHFTQPDSIVPDLYNSQDWNRYSYARYNPVLYTDPTGHFGLKRDDRSNYRNRITQKKVYELENQWVLEKLANQDAGMRQAERYEARLDNFFEGSRAEISLDPTENTEILLVGAFCNVSELTTGSLFILVPEAMAISLATIVALAALPATPVASGAAFVEAFEAVNLIFTPAFIAGIALIAHSGCVQDLEASKSWRRSQ